VQFLSAAFLALPAAGQVKITGGTEKIPIEINGKAFSDFYVGGKEVSKPYLFPLRAASGTYVTRMWPMETVAEEEGTSKDHRHHRGLWFAHASVNHLDFWNVDPAPISPYNRPDRGKIVLDKLGAVNSGQDKGSIAATF